MSSHGRVSSRNTRFLIRRSVVMIAITAVCAGWSCICLSSTMRSRRRPRCIGKGGSPLRDSSGCSSLTGYVRLTCARGYLPLSLSPSVGNLHNRLLSLHCEAGLQVRNLLRSIACAKRGPSASPSYVRARENEHVLDRRPCVDNVCRECGDMRLLKFLVCDAGHLQAKEV
eukprot:6195382-Pleurochrysis_carterae.AAC.2